MILSTVPVHKGDLFSWLHTAGVNGMAEASDLGRRPFGLVYDDAMDLGFYVESHQTGEKRLFTLVEEKKDGHEGEVQHWVFADSTGLKICVFND